ncbi:MAG TPA: hypothetical protein PKY88_08240 [Anaerohalosphaeraceae bacterium]|nr:hypothetical protein [Anaerohalosphaeraceae bacterium]
MMTGLGDHRKERDRNRGEKIKTKIWKEAGIQETYLCFKDEKDSQSGKNSRQPESISKIGKGKTFRQYVFPQNPDFSQS